MLEEIDKYLKKLFPINRSITGEGNRETLRILQEIIPLKIIEYPSGQKVYDWVIPKEWNIKDAWVKDSRGNKIINLEKAFNIITKDIKENFG
jgi:aminopeptidase-like protein